MSYSIGIDALGIDEPGGARTAVFYLFKELFSITPDWDFTIYLSKKENDFEEFKNVTQIILPFKKGLFSRIGAQLFFIFETLIKHYDLFHFAKSQGSIIFSKKKLLTIFDLTILNIPSHFKKVDFLFWKYIQPFYIKHFDNIITISNDAKNDIIKFYNIVDDKVKIVYCSSQFDRLVNFDLEAIFNFRKKYNINYEYILFLGIIAKKKNLSTIVKAFKYLKDQQIKIPKLLLAGPFYPQSDGTKIFSEIKMLNLVEDIIYIGKVNQEDLIGLYQGSRIFLMPSTHEGFGIPILEALQCGVPVIASNSSSIPEVLGEAGILIDDYLDPQIWAIEILDLLQNKNKYQILKDKSVGQVKKFNWNTSAKKLKSIYLSNLMNNENFILE